LQYLAVMKTRPFVYAAVALSMVALSVPSPVQAGMGFGGCSSYVQPVVTVDVSPASPDPGSQAIVTCTVDWSTGPSGPINVSVAGGTLDPAGLVTITSQTYTAPAAWVTPATAGTYNVTCFTAQVGTSGLCSKAATTTKIVPVGVTLAPPSISGISGPAQLIGGASGGYAVSASDPQSLPMTYAWSASGGTIVSSDGTASWQAPSAPGTYTLTVTATNSLGLSSAPATIAVQSLLAAYQADLPVSMVAPHRLAVSEGGQIVAIDARRGATGQLVWLSARGEPMGLVPLPEFPQAVTYGAGAFWVTTTAGSVLKLDALTGQVLAKLELQDGPFNSPEGIGFEPTRMTLWVADIGAGMVRIIRLDGTTVAKLDNVWSASDVAVDSARSRVWVLRFSVMPESSLAPGEPVTDARFLYAFDPDGNLTAAYVAQGSSAGQLARAGGIAVDASGKVYVTDTFQGTVSVFDPSGVYTTTVGQFGTSAGGLQNPSGLAFMKNGDLLVANTGQGRIDRIGVGAALPTCTVNGLVDSDCDGLPDEWELAHGLNPNFAGDAFLAYGGSGLNYAQVYAYESGNDPWAPLTVIPSVPATTPPGLVRLAATTNAAPACGTAGISWVQVSGPPVALQGANTAAARFIARTAATYGFDVTPTCLGTAGAATHVNVTVIDVPPVADGGGLVVASAGSPIRLDAAFSSDANGDALAFAWDQTLGRSVSGTTPGSTLTVRPRQTGVYRFELTATETATGVTGTADIPVLVMKGTAPTAVVVASAPEANVGAVVELNATASLVTASNQTFTWEQVAGADVALTDVEPGIVSFQPGAPGRYAFDVSVVSPNGRLSPPARVEVLVAAASAALPALDSASADQSVVDVNTPVALTASGTGTGYAWRQVAGPAAGLTDAGAATATAVAFAPGYYVFEVVAKDGDAVSHPRRVAFEARSGGQPIPVARASSPGLAPVVGQLVFLDGRASTGAAHFRWTQVEGAWVVLSAQASVASFKPPAAGRYVFELVVDDGSVRSAPARVELNVSEQGVP
jgi:sugar lactone lactonase YvrE